MQLSARMQTESKRRGLGPNKMRLGSQEKRWIIQPPDARAAQLAKSLKISPLLAQLLINRGITDAQAGKKDSDHDGRGIGVVTGGQEQ